MNCFLFCKDFSLVILFLLLDSLMSQNFLSLTYGTYRVLTNATLPLSYYHKINVYVVINVKSGKLKLWNGSYWSVWGILSFHHVLKMLRPLSVYSMGDESSNEMKFSPTRKRNWHLRFILFFLLTCWEESILFSQINSFSVQSFQNVCNKKKNLEKKTSVGSVTHTIYWEWPNFYPRKANKCLMKRQQGTDQLIGFKQVSSNFIKLCIDHAFWCTI